MKKRTKTRAKRTGKYRSSFEERTAKLFDKEGIPFTYEKDSITFTQERKYLPDFKIGNFYIEVKGYFRSSDRGKHLLIRKQNPSVDIRFLFMNAHVRLSKASRTTYAEWAERYGFKWAHRDLPDEWIKEAQKET